jgi:formylglycine-generating enzyme required for sulfatase activity
VDVQYLFDPHPRRYHIQLVNMQPFLMDTYPVTQADFARYLAAVPSALPTDTWHYLKNWVWSSSPTPTSSSPKPDSNPDPEESKAGTPTPVAGNEMVPVTYVGLAEARAYCTWAGKRLPSDIEWQYAAQVLCFFVWTKCEFEACC